MTLSGVLSSFRQPRIRVYLQLVKGLILRTQREVGKRGKTVRGYQGIDYLASVTVLFGFGCFIILTCH